MSANTPNRHNLARFPFPACVPYKLCTNMHTEQIWSFAFTDSLIFVDMLPLTLQHFSLPHLFSFHQQDFKAHFVSSATVPPFLPLPPLHLLQPSPTAGGEIISNTPSLVLASPSSLPSLSPSKLSATPSSASCLHSSPPSPFYTSS